VPPPEDLKPMTKPSQAEMDKLPEKLRRWLQIERPFEFRPVQTYNPLAPVACEPVRQIWMRAVDKLPDDDTLHHCLLAYISDYWLLDTSTMPHGSSFLRGNLVMASIDHAIWFHRPGRVDDWLLYSLDSPSSSGARGFARGSFYSRDGVLIASTAQEGLIRLVQPPS
jgi:acyl-CoA thioesterase-2